MVSLRFRAGFADEPASHRGVTHLVEHLAFRGLGRREYELNGFVDLLTCNFHAFGTQPEVESYVGDVVASLASLPLDDIETEKRVLWTEAISESGDFITEAMSLRFGISGLGGFNLKEIGLRWLGQDDVDRWRIERFCAQNAAIWIHAPEPPQFQFSLAEGSRQPSPRCQPLERLTFPAFSDNGAGEVGVAMLAPRSAATPIGLSIVSERLEDSLRMRDGVAYDVHTRYEPIGVDTAHIAIGAECHDRDVDRVAEEIMGVIEALAADGPTQQELDSARRRMLRARDEDRNFFRVELDQAVFNELLGDGRTIDSQLAELDALDVTAVQELFAKSAGSLLMVAPGGTKSPRSYLLELERPPVEITGRRFKAKSLVQLDEVLIGDEGVSMRDGDGLTSIPAHEIALVTRSGNGVLTITGLDGSGLVFDPKDIRESSEAVEIIERLAGGAIIPEDTEVEDHVVQVADEKLDRKWVAREALALLPDALEEDERVVTLCEASRGMKAGLLTITDRRALFIFVGLRNEEVLRFPHAAIRNARKAGLRGGKLLLDLGNETLEFKNIRPRQRADEVVAALRSGSTTAARE